MSADAAKKMALWVDMWKNHEVPASDVAYVAIRLVAESDSADVFRLLPHDIQEEAKGIAAQFEADGKAELTAKGGAAIVDISSQLQRFIAALKADGIDLSSR